MGGLTSLVTNTLPAVASVASSAKSLASSTSSSSSSSSAADQRAFELQKQQLQWEHDDAVRQQEAAAKAAQDQADQLAAARQRANEMNWLTQSQNSAADQLRANQAQSLAELRSSTQTQLAQVNADAAAVEKRRVAALRRAMATTRATLGGNGVSADGSGEAILLGQVADTSSDRQDSQASDQLKRQALQQQIDDANRRNLLEQAQLADKQRLEFMSKFY